MKKSLLGFITLCFLIEVVASLWTKESVSTWYPTLIKPSWTPPNWVFGPVWTLLFLLIGIAGWLIYLSPVSKASHQALIYYGIQLALNFMWSFLFFSMRNPTLGLFDISLLLFFIALTIYKTWFVRPLASLLLLPYLFWVMYAASLNAAIWYLN